MLVEEFEKHRLPMLLAIRDKVSEGELLEAYEFDFLSRFIEDARYHMPICHGHPVLEEFCTHVLHLYTEICGYVTLNEESYSLKVI